MLLIFNPMGNAEGEGWGPARIMMAVPQKLIDALKNYGDRISKVRQRDIDKIRQYEADPENKIANINEVSQAAHGLHKWVKATVNLYEVNKKVEPLKIQLEKMTKQKEATEEDLRKTKDLLDKLTAEVADLQKQSDIKTARLNELTATAETMARKLNAAKKLITGLTGEKIRWTNDT